MPPKKILLIGFILLGFTTAPALGAPSLPPATQWLPPNALISLEITQPKALLNLFTDKNLTEKIQAMPIYQKQASKKGFQEFLGLINLIETTLNTDWRTGLAKLTGGGIILAVFPQDKVVVIIDAEDSQMLKQLHDFFLNIARTEAEKKGRPDTVQTQEYQGIPYWSFDSQEAHTIIDNRLIFSNHFDGLKEVLDLRTHISDSNLANSTAYRDAKQTVGSNPTAMVYANLGILKSIPGVAKALNQGKNNPLAALFLAGITESIRSSNWLALKLQVQEKTMHFQAMMDGAKIDPAGPAAFSLPDKPDEGAWPNLQVPRYMAGLSFYRDLHRFYAAKDDLFPERTSGLIFFENMMGIFFSGRDLTDEVLAETKPEIRLVVAEQNYNPEIGIPQVKLPAFAVVLRLRDPEDFDEVMEEAWQKALGLINFTRGQQALQGLIIDRPIHNQTKFTIAYFSSAGLTEKTSLHQRYNFRPALAMPDNYVILSSTEELTRDLIDTLQTEIKHPAKALAHTHSLVEINGLQVSSILKANYETLVRNNMVKEGHTQEEAESAIDILITVVQFIDQLKLSVGMQENITRADLELKLNLP
ncbi:MAG: DUF3352 domain-containing protein [Sedimentisphaerales bacterium]|nr:DUF3352 domain-containing protein [Sedimentisphaerales bacterium]